MVVTCEQCGLSYDDMYRLTFCPHKRFEMHTIVNCPDGTEVCAHSVAELRQIEEEWDRARASRR